LKIKVDLIGGGKTGPKAVKTGFFSYNRVPDMKAAFKSSLQKLNCCTGLLLICSLHHKQELISRLNSQTLCPVNILGHLVLSNNIKNGTSDIRDLEHR